MSRVIKFRAWDGSKMAEVTELSFSEGELVAVSTRPNGDDETLVEVMQFTGLLDKNGKEIYEGDMLGTKGSEGGSYPFYKTGYVIFEKGAFTLQALGEGQKDERFEFRKELEIIGNIYENPELLKV